MNAIVEKEITSPSPVLKASRDAYREQVAELATRFPEGHYAVFHGPDFQGAFATYGEALDKGYEVAGNAPFFVKQIRCMDEVQCVASPIHLDA